MCTQFSFLCHLSGWKEGNVLFNDALNTFYSRLYGEHMVKDHSDSEKGNLLLSHGLLFPINIKGSFICTIPQTPVVVHWLEQEIAQWVPFVWDGGLSLLSRKTGRKVMFYLMEGGVLFNDTLNTFYL